MNAMVAKPETVFIRLPNGKAFDLDTEGTAGKSKSKSTPSFRVSSQQWTYVVRSRQRWATTEETTEAQNDAAYELVTGLLKVTSSALRQIAEAQFVEVSLPWRGDSSAQGWAECIFPWEYVLAGATHRYRRTQSSPLTVVRQLRVQDKRTKEAATPRKFMFVVSEPGALRGEYNFESERDLIHKHLKPSDSDNWKTIESPTAAEIKSTVARFKPDVIHISAFDTHLVQFLYPDGRKPPSSARIWSKGAGKNREADGLVLAGAGGLMPTPAKQLCEILTAKAKQRPDLVAMNFGNSAARLAPQLLVKGAQNVVGLQDTFDDDLAEMFFALFYSNLKLFKWDYGTAFRLAWEHIRHEASLRKGSGVVLWSRQSLVTRPDTRVALTKSGAAEVQAKLEQRQQPIDADSPDADAVAAKVKVAVDTFKDINYSVLHNRRPVFKLFAINSEQPLKDVTIWVSLNVGSVAATYERTLNVRHPSENLTEEIHLPLTSELARSVQESINSSIFVEVKWRKRVLYSNSHRVRLTPVDQWRDNDTDGKWLPSFIFPRDPAVSRIVDTAQRYVRVLRDDPDAGFEGYQALDPKADEEFTDIDLQVQAIWSAIVHEMRLGYINPPPAYTSELDSQRLRTPSTIERYHSGTCLDLALFFAACLESVEIYPVIFLLNDHAFPGYWRSNAYQEQFRKVIPRDVPHEVTSLVATAGGDVSQRDPWISRKTNYREIKKHINRERLVPIETVALTESSGFWDAVTTGRKNLDKERDFHSMLDIAIAREIPVTPLPIQWERS